MKEPIKLDCIIPEKCFNESPVDHSKSTITLSDLMKGITTNYGICNVNNENYIGLQNWI